MFTAMQFRIADTFTDSLARLSNEDQKAVKTTAFDLQLNPANPGMQFHRIERAKDKNFWSARVGSDIRLIIHKTASSLLLCYAGHHDDAYAWAERRKIETHPTTGAAQLVEIRERIQDIVIPKYVEQPKQSKPAPKLFNHVSEQELLSYGVPAEWMNDVRQATEDTIFEVATHLPPEAAEALLQLATGGTPTPPILAPVTADPFAHPDAQRRFRIMTNAEELQQALDYPWEKWSVFLHPAQRDIVERQYKGPARVTGSAGTGKTIVALHRAVYLARKYPNGKILLTTFSDPLARALKSRLRVLTAQDQSLENRIAVQSIDSVGIDLYSKAFAPPKLVSESALRQMLITTSKTIPNHPFKDRFLWTEWNEIADAWQLNSWEDYRDVARLGRKTRLTENKRQILWQIFARVRADLGHAGLMTMPMIFDKLTQSLSHDKSKPFNFVIVDEAQDISVSQLRFLGAIAGRDPNGLLFTGDLGQRIFQAPFSWKSLGVDIRGRSHTLRINYRTSHQIRRHADRLLPNTISDVDGISDERAHTISAFNGPDPTIKILASEEEERATVAAWLKQLLAKDVQPGEVGVFVRSEEQIVRALKAIEAAQWKFAQFDTHGEAGPGLVSVGTMHMAKGLEYKAVVVMACDDEIIPLQERTESIADEADLIEVYESERHLLYVACTRARDNLLVTAISPGSEFLDDMRTKRRS
jgi:superfamily I DNA/RNA helicase/mRNA-degrading endonuclease RelE of RelBE toxin-antitoxin system